MNVYNGVKVHYRINTVRDAYLQTRLTRLTEILRCSVTEIYYYGKQIRCIFLGREILYIGNINTKKGSKKEKNTHTRRNNQLVHTDEYLHK